MNRQPPEHRHLMFCNLGKVRDKIVLAFHLCPSTPLSCRTSHSISGGALYSRNNASRRYNVAIEAQKQKECHAMNLSV